MTEPQLPTGSRIGQYEIREFIARGGMAEVYLAFDAELERPVALKIMLPALAADAQYVERFRREARTVARLNHPNIVQVYSVGLTPETKRPYIAMQYIEGGSLDDVLAQLAGRGKLLPTDQALLIIRQIAEALAAAHNAGVIHRDLKPSNVLIRPDGAPMLVDLGIAAVSDKTRLTQTGGLIGTPHYMSPEQVRGQELDGRSDLYALGVMLYEMLAGKRPFVGDSIPAILHQQAYEKPIPLAQLRPDLSSKTLSIVESCMQKEPVQRFPNAEAVIRAIDLVINMEGKPELESKSTFILTQLLDDSLLSRQKVIKSPGKYPVLPGWVIATFLTIVASVVIFFAIQSLRNLTTNPTITDEPKLATGSPTNSSIEIETKAATIPVPTSRTQQSESVPSPTVSPTSIAASTSAPTENPTVTSTPQFVNPLSGSGLIRMTSSSGTEYTPFLSPDQRTLLFMSNDIGTWQIYKMDVTSGEIIRVTKNDSNNYHPHFSPDGERIIFASEISGDWEIYTMRLDGSELQRLTNRSGEDQYPSFSPDGQWIVFMSQRGNGWGVYVIDTNGENERVVIDDVNDESFPLFSPDGQTIVYQYHQGANNHDIFTIPWQGGTPQQITTHSARDANPAYSPDGKWITFESNRTGNYDIFAVRLEDGNLINLTNHSSNDQLPTFSADGDWVLFQSDREDSVDIFRLSFES